MDGMVTWLLKIRANEVCSAVVSCLGHIRYSLHIDVITNHIDRVTHLRCFILFVNIINFLAVSKFNQAAIWLSNWDYLNFWFFFLRRGKLNILLLLPINFTLTMYWLIILLSIFSLSFVFILRCNELFCFWQALAICGLFFGWGCSLSSLGRTHLWILVEQDHWRIV